MIKIPLVTIAHRLLQFDAEFRRWSFRRQQHSQFEEFSKQVAELHRLALNDQVLLSYIDPQDNDLLPINNDDNFGRALKTAKPLLRLIVQRKGKLWACGWGAEKEKL